jgi:hypothetical protein
LGEIESPKSGGGMETVSDESNIRRIFLGSSFGFIKSAMTNVNRY